MGMRVWIWSAVVVAVVFGGLAGAALVAWPRVGLGGVDDALAGVVLPGFAGRVVAARVSAADGVSVPVVLRGGKLWPLRKLAAGERLTVELAVRRPSWAAWLVGRSERRSFTVETPIAHLRGRWLQVKPGAPVTVAFDAPVSVVSFGKAGARRLATPRAVVSVGVLARGSNMSGAIDVAVAARSWERLGAPVRVSWFPARPFPQLLAEPKPGAALAPGRQLVLTFSRPVVDVLGARRPRLSPATPGRWRLLDAHTLAFRPGGLGFGLGTSVRVELPRRSVSLVRPARRSPGRLAGWCRPVRRCGCSSCLPSSAICRSAGSPQTRHRRRRGRSSWPQSRRPGGGFPGATRTPRLSCARSGRPAGRIRSRAAR